MTRSAAIFVLTLLAATFCPSARAKILWSYPNAWLIHNDGMGTDILNGAVQRNETNNDALYFKFHVDPLSDAGSEPYFAGFQLFKGDQPRLGVGNAEEAWGYSAFNTAEIGPSNVVAGEYNLMSAHPEPANADSFRPYELVHHDVERTIVFKVQYVPGGDDLVTVWLDPNLSLGATEKNQPADITTKFKANARFNQIRLRHSGGGNGWIFSDMAIATSFNDFVVERYWQTWWFRSMIGLLALAGVAAAVRVAEKRKYQLQLQRSEQARALEQERSRIAQDLHDELGSSLTRLSLLSGLIRTDKDNPEQVVAHAGKLAQSADQTVRALEEIVWAVRPGSDSLQSLADYIVHFADELFDGNATHCRLDLPHSLPAIPLPPDMRHNIFLIVKEALTNALKHAGAQEVQLQAKVSGPRLEILVQDDGKGFDPASLAESRRNGAGNMRRRAEAVGGKLEWQSAPGRGTTVKFSVNLPDGTINRKT
jgi:signal transduction histidine kinase